MLLSTMPSNNSGRVGRCMCDLILLHSQTRAQGQKYIKNSIKVRYKDLHFGSHLSRTSLLPTSYKTIFSTGSTRHSGNRLITSTLYRLSLDSILKTNFHYYNKEIIRSFTTYSVKNKKNNKGSKERTVRLLNADTGGVVIDKYVDFGDVDQSEWKRYYLKSIDMYNTETSETLDKMSTKDILTETKVAQNSDNASTGETDKTPGLACDEGADSVQQGAGSQNDVGAGVHVNMGWEALVDDSKLSQEELQIHLLHRDAVKNGEDFYLDPITDLYVTTRFGHLKRGECCGNACRHCPFGLVNVPIEERRKRFFNSAFYVWKVQAD